MHIKHPHKYVFMHIYKSAHVRLHVCTCAYVSRWTWPPLRNSEVREDPSSWLIAESRSQRGSALLSCKTAWFKPRYDWLRRVTPGALRWGNCRATASTARRYPTIWQHWTSDGRHGGQPFPSCLPYICLWFAASASPLPRYRVWITEHIHPHLRRASFSPLRPDWWCTSPVNRH